MQQYADQIGGLIPSMLGKYQQGNPAVNAAQGYVTDTLSRTGGNPYLQQMIDQSGEDTYNTMAAQAGTRGLTGGSAFNRMIGNAVSRNAMGLRYQDYGQEQQLKANAAGMAPGLSAADTIQIAPLLSAAQFAGGSPMDATTRYAAGMGGLFGNTGSQTTTTSPGLGGILGTALAAWAGKGG